MRAISNALANLLQNVSNGWAWLADMSGEVAWRWWDEVLSFIDYMLSLVPQLLAWSGMALSEFGTKIALWALGHFPDMPDMPGGSLSAVFPFANRYLPVSEMITLMTFTLAALALFLTVRLVLWVVDFIWIG